MIVLSSKRFTWLRVNGLIVGMCVWWRCWSIVIAYDISNHRYHSLQVQIDRNVVPIVGASYVLYDKEIFNGSERWHCIIYIKKSLAKTTKSSTVIMICTALSFPLFVRSFEFFHSQATKTLLFEFCTINHNHACNIIWPRKHLRAYSMNEYFGVDINCITVHIIKPKLNLQYKF